MTQLREMRKKRGLTQVQLAEAAGINLATLRSYESGARSINKAAAEDVARMARILHCISEDLLEGF